MALLVIAADSVSGEQGLGVDSNAVLSLMKRSPEFREDTAMITSEQIEFYRENGYVSVEGILSADEVSDLRRVTDDFVEQSRQFSEHTDVFDLEPSHTPQDPRVRRIKNPNLQHAVYDRTLRHEGILDIVERLIGPGIRYQSTKLNMKNPAHGSPVEWHQDWGFYPHTNDNILAVGVAIDAMSLDNGCLLVVPGSHRGKVHRHSENGFFVGAVTDTVIDKAAATPVTVGAGGISIHHVRTLHASAPNTSSAPRRLMLLELKALDAWPLSGYGKFDEFNAKILRGKPSSEPRLEPVAVHMPEPKHEHGGSIYEVQSQASRHAFSAERA